MKPVTLKTVLSTKHYQAKHNIQYNSLDINKTSYKYTQWNEQVTNLRANNSNIYENYCFA